MWLIVWLLLLIPYSTQAATCVEDNISKCAELGYTEKSCPYGGIACQYDRSLWHCARWSCRDGRYYTAKDKPSGYDCIEVDYKGMSCYDCILECTNGQVDFSDCWDNMLRKLVKDSSFCETMGYIDKKDGCVNFLACPADATKVRCFDD